MATTTLTKGGNAPITAPAVELSIRWGMQRGEVDASAFVLRADGRVGGDHGMVFYGQQSSPEGAVAIRRLAAPSGGGAETAFAVDLARLPADVERIAFTGTLHDAGLSFADVASLEASVRENGAETVRFPLDTRGAPETAMILVELYRRAGAWKVRAVGQGYEGGLRPLAESFGVDVADEAAAPAAPPEPPRVVDLRKRIVDLSKRDPGLAASAGKAMVSLEKRGIAGIRARFALVLDISASMDRLFRSGKIDQLVTRAMALGFQMDDDGDIDVFLFGKNAHHYGSLNVDNYKGFAAACVKRFGFEPDTMYGAAIDMVRDHYFRMGRSLPVYVMFVTDGGTRDTRRSKDSITAASREPIFWQFMAIGEYEGGSAPAKIGRVLPRGFDFLAMLDDMPGRLVDNANFFAVADPSAPSDEELYGMMFEEFPDWLNKARAARVLEDNRQ